MTLSELKAISDACAKDAEFLAHAEVRRVWWKALGDEGPWKHELRFFGINDEPVAWHCLKCETVYNGEIGFEVAIHAMFQQYYSKEAVCLVPDFIPGSLADAVERLREKVAEQWKKMSDTAVETEIERMDDLIDWLNGYVHWVRWYVLDTPRDRFLVFAAALGAVQTAEAEKENP